MADGGERSDVVATEAVRVELARIVGSTTFSHSPQLTNFLRFVVETTLAGHADRLKGYTIGVEALGRPAEFDPQVDPIVRVEAGRLRRALARYYAEEGGDDPLLIDLPSGSYVPTFIRRGQPPRAPWSLRAKSLPVWLGLAVAIAVMAAVGAGIAYWHANKTVDQNLAGNEYGVDLPGGSSPFPVLSVDPFDTNRLPEQAAAAVMRFRVKLRDALARFDELDVAAEPPTNRPDVTGAVPASTRNVYRLVGSAEVRSDGTLGLYLRLYDMRDGLIVWTRTVNDVHIANATVVNEDELLFRIAPVIAQPYGVIYARELSRTPRSLDPRYHCVIVAFEFYRWHGPGQRQQLHNCLGPITTPNSTFAVGFALLALEQLRDYYDNVGATAALDRAVRSAQRAASLDSQSARAYQALMNALYARGDVAAAMAAGQRAMSLNPWDMITTTSFAIRLMWNGELDRAMALLQQADEYGPGQPQFLSYALFVASYMRDDYAAAARYANRMISDNFAYGIAARAVAAVRTGEPDRAQREVRRLLRLRPSWRTDAQAELQRYGMPAATAARMVSDLATAGLRAGN